MPVCGRFRKSPQAEPDRITGSPDNRLPRNEFRGKRTNPDQIGFGKCPMQETAPTAESYPIKMSQKDIAMKMERFIMEAIIETIAFSLFRYIEPALLP